MPIIIAAAAAMQYYYKNNEYIQTTIRHIDPNINLKQKSIIRLHDIEQTMTLYEPPITTITYCSTTSMKTDFLIYFQQRLERILQVNPWLCGWLLPMPDLHIVFDPTGRDRTPSYFTVHTTARPRRHPHQYEDHHYDMYQDTIVLSNHDLIGRNLPIFKISIVPIDDATVDHVDANSTDATVPYMTTNEYAIVMSMSHLVGDAHTYYQIYNMLFFHDENDHLSLSIPSIIRPLNPIRVSNYVSSIQDIFGNDPHTSILKPPRHPQSQTKVTTTTTDKNTSSLQQRQEEITKKMKAKLFTFMKNVKTKRSSSCDNIRNSNMTTKDMASINKDAVPAISDDSRMPDLDTSYDSHHSSSTTGSTISSSNDDRTSHNIASMTTPDISIQQAQCEETPIPTLPMQQLPQKRVMKVFRIDSEWILTQRNESLVAGTNNTTISVNSLLSSWFYRITEASTCILMMNLRHKIDTHCTITNTDVGNYAHTVMGDPTEFYHPHHVQNAVMNIAAVNTTQSSSTASLSSITELVDILKVNVEDEASIRSPKKVSICTNWINFPITPTKTSNATTCQIKLHLPIYNKDYVTRDIPNPPALQSSPDVSVMTLFHLQQSPAVSCHSSPDMNANDTISTNDGVDVHRSHTPSTGLPSTTNAAQNHNIHNNNSNNNIGAMIICSEQVWIDHIVPSGMVESILP